MKTSTKLALATLTAALLSTGSVLADNSGFYSVDNHRGNVTTTVSQPKTTVAFGGSAKGSQAPKASGQKTLKQINTAHGTTLYFTE